MKRLFTKEDIQTADMYMKRCSPPSAIRQMQIKTMMRCHYTPMRTAKVGVVIAMAVVVCSKER